MSYGPSEFPATPSDSHHVLSMTSGYDSRAANPWAEVENSSTYDRDLAAIVAKQDNASTGNGSDNSPMIRDSPEQRPGGTYGSEHEVPLKATPIVRPEFLGRDEAEESRPGTASSSSYTAKLRSILGSEESEDPSSSFEGSRSDKGKDPLRDTADTVSDTHVDVTFELPDNSLRSISIAPDNGKLQYRPALHKGRDPSLSYSINSSHYSSFEGPRRPAEYPTISRLRASGILQPMSPKASRAADRFRFPFGSMSSLSSVNRDHAEMLSSEAASHSRSTSISGSLSGQRNRIFPYGASPLDAASDFSGDTSVQVRSDRNGLALDPNDSARISMAERGIFKWSALRKVAVYFQERGRRPCDIPLPIPKQVLPSFTGDKTVFVVGGSQLAIGTTEGYTLIFGFSQDLRCICGSQSLSRTAGEVTSLAFSADNTFVAIGHAKGFVFLYDVTKPASPARQVAPVTASEVSAGRKEGHLIGSKVLHVAFVGARHTAIFTADENGLSFYHSLGKILGVASNDTLRILGRYPEPAPLAEATDDSRSSRRNRRKSSPILALIALPLGPIEHASDLVHFVALLTIQKLIIVGLSPSARTWYRKSAPRASPSADPLVTEQTSTLNPSETAAVVKIQDFENGEGTPGLRDTVPTHVLPDEAPSEQSYRTACASWFPALQAKEVSSCTDATGCVPPRLVLAFDRQVFLLDLIARETPKLIDQSNTSSSQRQNQQQKTTELQFAERMIWSEPTETIEALQWLSHELILLQTTTSLKLLDLRVGRVTERESLEPTLHALIRPLWIRPEEARLSADRRQPDPTFVAQSMRSHNGRAFFVTESQIVVGQLITWTDRLLSLVAAGDFLSAIDLATEYYEGKVVGSLIGLPQDRALLKQQVGNKLRELMSASARYTFSPDRLTDTTHITSDGRGVDRTELFISLTRSCAQACLAMGDMDFLFDDLYQLFSSNGIEAIFVEQLVDFILSGQMKQLPIPVTQRLIASCQRNERWDVAEKIIWHIDPLCLDLDQVLSMCSKQKLYDAMIYVFNAALHDFVSPLVELLTPLKCYLSERESGDSANGWPDESRDAVDAEEYNMQPAMCSEGYKILSYISVILTGRSYPAQEPLGSEVGQKAKSSLYKFLFSGHSINWPPGGGGKLVLSVDESKSESTFPYLLLLLRFDAEAFLDALDIAFEDSFLDGDDDDSEKSKHDIERSMSRQTIVDILLEVSGQLSEAELMFLVIFICRNAPKYPQFLRLSYTTVGDLLRNLCQLGNESNRDDRQLATESILSARKHSFTDEELSMFEQAGFWRILQSAYKSAGKWEKLTSMLLNDPDLGEEIFPRLEEVLTKAISRSQRSNAGDALRSTLLKAVPQLMRNGTWRTAVLIDRFYSDKHWDAVETLEADEEAQLDYLRVFIDPPRGLAEEEDVQRWAQRPDEHHLDGAARELFLTLQSRLDPTSLLRILDDHQSDTAYFDLETVSEAARRNGAYDAVLWSLDKQGQSSKAFDALDEIIACQALKMRRVSRGSYQIEELASQLRRATRMAVRICGERCELPFRGDSPSPKVEEMWYRLLRSLVGLIHAVANPIEDSPVSSYSLALELSREIVQDTLSTMVTSMSAATVSFPYLFRRLVDANDPFTGGGNVSSFQGVRYYAEVKTVVEGMVAACRLRMDLLKITNRILDRDTFSTLAQLTKQSKRGWRPRDDLQRKHPFAVRSAGSFDNSATSRQQEAGASVADNASNIIRRRLRRTSSTSTAATLNPTRKTPSRVIDFLTSSSSSSLLEEGMPPSVPTYVNSPATGHPSSPVAPRPDKGKGRERTVEEWPNRAASPVGRSAVGRKAGGGTDPSHVSVRGMGTGAEPASSASEAEVDDPSSTFKSKSTPVDLLTSQRSDPSESFSIQPNPHVVSHTEEEEMAIHLPASSTEAGLLTLGSQQHDFMLGSRSRSEEVSGRRGPIRVRLGRSSKIE